MDLCRWALGVSSVSNAVVSYGGRWGYEDAGETANTQVIVHDYGDRSLVFEVRGLSTDEYRGAKIGIIVECTEGYLVMTSYHSGAAFDLTGNKVAEFSGGSDALHYTNFLSAVRSRKLQDLNADIEEGHLSSALCHLGNISYRLGEEVAASQVAGRLTGFNSRDNNVATLDRTLSHLRNNQVDLDKARIRVGAPLAVNPATETFMANDTANSLLTRAYRKPFVVPAAGQV
jgi:hypothetical protein